MGSIYNVYKVSPFGYKQTNLVIKNSLNYMRYYGQKDILKYKITLNEFQTIEGMLNGGWARTPQCGFSARAMITANLNNPTELFQIRSEMIASIAQGSQHENAGIPPDGLVQTLEEDQASDYAVRNFGFNRQYLFIMNKIPIHQLHKEQQQYLEYFRVYGLIRPNPTQPNRSLYFYLADICNIYSYPPLRYERTLFLWWHHIEHIDQEDYMSRQITQEEFEAITEMLDVKTWLGGLFLSAMQHLFSAPLANPTDISQQRDQIQQQLGLRGVEPLPRPGARDDPDYEGAPGAGIAPGRGYAAQRGTRGERRGGRRGGRGGYRGGYGGGYGGGYSGRRSGYGYQ